MTARRLILTLSLILAAGAALSALSNFAPVSEPALPAAEGEVPRIVIVGRREHAADERR